MKKRRWGLAVLSGIIVLVAGSGFLMLELHERSLYRTQESNLKAAIGEFQARCVMAENGDFSPVVLAEKGTRNPGKVQISSDMVDASYPYRNHAWVLNARFEDPPSGMSTSTHGLVFIVLVQKRTAFLHPPKIHVLGLLHPCVKKVFDDILLDHGLTYTSVPPPGVVNSLFSFGDLYKIWQEWWRDKGAPKAE